MMQYRFYYKRDDYTLWHLYGKGRKFWHRLDGPAFEKKDNKKYWYIQDKEDLIIEYRDGDNYWFINDDIFFLDGPAVDWLNNPYKLWNHKWCINGKELPTKEVEEWLHSNKINLKTSEGQLAFKMKWG